MINLDNYIDKVKKFNDREDYLKDIKTAKFFLENYLSNVKSKKIYFIGTGLGGDSKIIQGIKNPKVIGVEPRDTFQEQATKVYNNFGGKLMKMDLGEFSKINSKLSGIFLFIHSINHISKNQLMYFQKIVKNSFIIIINPNPEIEKIVGKTDQTVISYLKAKEIETLLKSEIVFDFFYNKKKIKTKEIFLREIIIFKTN
jgi:hypothetical protein